MATINGNNIKNSMTPQMQDNVSPDDKIYILPNPKVKYLTTNEVVYRVLRPEDLQLLKPSITKIAKQGRPRRIISTTKHVEQVITDVNSVVPPLKVCRTRSGRMSKPPKHILQEDSDHVIIIDQGKPSSMQLEEKLSLPVAGKRKIASQNRCNTCKKAFFGKSRMSKHLQLNPGHVAQAAKMMNRSDDLWSELVRRAQNHSRKFGEQQPTSHILCDEFVRLLYRARTVIPKLLKPLVGECDSYYEIDEITGNALGVPQGKYVLKEFDHVNDMSMKNITKPTVTVAPSCDVLVQMQKNEPNSLLHLLVDTEQDTFDSNASNSEEVDQLVNERLKTFAGGVGSAPELSPISASLNLNLDLSSLDTMFAYHAS